MNIQDLEGCTVKLGATSITAKKDNGKTVGIVTQVRRFTNAPSRIKFDFAKAARPAMHAGKLDQLYIDGKNLYFLHNSNTEKAVENSPAIHEFFAESISKSRALCDELRANGITVVNVYFA